MARNTPVYLGKQHLLVLLASVLVFAAMLAVPTAAFAVGYDIQGNVSNPSFDYEPVRGVTVTLYKEGLPGAYAVAGTTTTTVDGDYTFSGLGAGNYKLAILQGATDTVGMDYRAYYFTYYGENAGSLGLSDGIALPDTDDFDGDASAGATTAPATGVSPAMAPLLTAQTGWPWA